MKSQPKLLAFNAGVISPLALARQDISKVGLHAETQTNWMPRHMGSMMLRPGLGFITPIIHKSTQTTLTVDVGGAKTLSSATGLANDATSYTATLTWAGALVASIAVTGSAAQTYATLLSEIYTDILSAGFGEDITVQLIGGNIVFTNQIRGSSVSLTLVDSGSNELFSSLTGFVAIDDAVLGSTGNESDSKLIPFLFSKDDTALISLVDTEVRIIVDDEYVVPPVSFSSNAVNGHFLYTLGSWTDDDDAGCTSSFVAGDDGAGYMSLVGTNFNYARRNQQVTVSVGDQDKEHQCRIVIARGVVELRIGTSAGDGSYVTATLTKGTHIFMFTPTASFYVEFSSSTKYASLVDSIYFLTFGLVMETDYTEGDFPLIRQTQSGNVIYLACKDIRPQKIERRGERSWSLVDYLPEAGPFLPYNSTGITLTASALSGDVTLTASHAFFQSGHVGALFLVDSIGQEVSSDITTEDAFSNEIRVTGITRSFFLTISSIGSNEVTLQRSVGEPGSWVDVSSYTTNQTNTVINDALDDQIIYYRIGIKTGDYSSGTTTVTLEYSQGSIAGICRVTKVASSTSASAIVLRDFGGTAATADWREGAWSTYRGFPSAVDLYEGRLWWAGKQFIDGSESDQYESFDPALEGDSRPIRRSIGFGSADNINWIAGGQNLLVATDTRVLVARSSREDYPLTQDDFSLKDVTSQGAAKISPLKVDVDVIYVHNSGSRLMGLSWDGARYIPIDLTGLTPEIGEPSITHIAAQHQPDLRIHCVRSDGKAAILLRDPVEGEAAFIEIETDGDIVDFFAFPGDVEDQVYYVTARTIDGDDVKYIEKWALESECQGGVLNKQLDSFILYSGASTTTLTGLTRLEGESVYVWSSGVQGPYTVASGSITIGTAVTSAVIGKRYIPSEDYDAIFKSVKLGQLMDKKQPYRVGLICRNVHRTGLKFGTDLNYMSTIPDTITGDIFEEYHKESIPIDGKWEMDSRLYLTAKAPYPATVLAAIIDMEGNSK